MSILLLESLQQGVLTLTLNRPEKKNALNDVLLGALVDAIATGSDDPDVRVMVITGAGGCFAAGADINRFGQFDANSIQEDTRPLLWGRIRACHKPLVAAVESWCLGAGAELALHCDIVIAGQSAQFALPEVSLGLIPGAGGTQRLPRSVSKSNAMWMLLTGDRVDAQRALAMGLISEQVAEGHSLERAQEIAARIANNAPLAVEAAKRAVLQSYETGLDQGLEVEREGFIDAFNTEDREEGVKAFLERRTASFKRR